MTSIHQSPCNRLRPFPRAISRLTVIAVSILMLTVINGCIRSQSSRVPGVHYDPLDSDTPVQVYAEEIPVGMDDILPLSQATGGIKLGSVMISGAEDASWNSVIDRAKHDARQLGGNVVIVKKWGYSRSAPAYASSGGMSLPVTSKIKMLVGEVRRLPQQ